MSDFDDFDPIIYTGTPEYHYTRPTGPRKTNKVIETLTRLEIGQFVHYPTDRNSKEEKKIKAKIKSTVEYVQRHFKPRRFRTGSAIHNGVWGVSIQRKDDQVSKNNLPF